MCAYNPGVQDIRGQLYAQGIASAASGIAEGIKAYGINKKQDAALTGLIEGYGTNLTNLAQKMTPDGQKLVEKFLKGNATLNDKTTLAGFLQAQQKLEEEGQQAQLRNLQIQQHQNMLQQMQQEQQTMQRLQGLGQFLTPQRVPTGASAPAGPQISAPSANPQANGPMSLGSFMRTAPTGVGVMSPESQTQMGRMAQNPAAVTAAQVLQATGRLPTPDNLLDFASRQATMAAKPQPIYAESLAELEKKYPPQKFDYAVSFTPEGKPYIPDGKINTRAPGDERQPFQLGQPMGDKSGKFLGYVAFDQRTGKLQLQTPEGKSMEMPEGATPVTATGMQRQIPDIKTFRKMKADVTDAEISLRSFDRYLDSVDNADVGIARLADRFTAGMKTLTGGKDPLSAKEIAAAAANGQLQALIGANRMNVVGGGVMTEQDASRIIQRLGGDAGAWSNPEIVKKAIKELYTDRYQQYQDDLLFFNNAVDDYYGERGHKRIGGTKFSPKLTGEQPEESLQIKSVRRIN